MDIPEHQAPTLTGPDDAPAAGANRRFRRFLTGMVLVFSAAMAGAIALPHDPYIRYQSFNDTIFDRLSWVYDRLAHDDTPIDVLFVGSSRTARGADAAGLQVALAAAGAGEVHVANISMPAAGLDVRLTNIRTALQHHPEIRLIVLGVVEALPRDGHQAFGDLGTARDILTAPWIVNRTLPGNLARLPYRQMELAIASYLPEAFGYRTEFDPAVYPGPTPDHRDFNRPGWETGSVPDRPETEPTVDEARAARLARESRRYRRAITPPILPESLAWIEFGVSRHYVREIADLAAAHDAQVAFLFLPFFQGYERPIDSAWLAGFGPVWRATHIMDDPRNYADAGHASRRGTELITPWLADRIRTVRDRTAEDERP